MCTVDIQTVRAAFIFYIYSSTPYHSVFTFYFIMERTFCSIFVMAIVDGEPAL